MEKLILKLLSFITLIRYPSQHKSSRYYIRDNYFSRLIQTKFLVKDYVTKDKYKEIVYKGEFQQELTFVLPFAYWHYLNGTLKRTISSLDTKDFYFFSKDHVEMFTQRTLEYDAHSFQFPNMTHTINFSTMKWAQVPLKEQYTNNTFIYAKPVLIIANKFNIEWKNFPLNFFNIPVLDKIITKYKQDYQIIYNRPAISQIVMDNSDILDLDEYDWIKSEHPEVLLVNDLYKQHQTKVNSFNHLQLLVYANCSHFISVHGGTAALASYFGGTNIILSKSGIEHSFNEFNTIFPALSGARILHAKTEDEVLDYLDKYY